MKTRSRHDGDDDRSGKLRIGDNWNAIRIIALSQSNPLKAVAEFVENSIDAKARHITIVRGKEKGVHFLRIKDDGEGIRRNEQGQPDFEYVATHICDSMKRRLKSEGAVGLQGEFGIGLLSFWTVGEELVITSAGHDGKTYQMLMRKGDPGYKVTQRRLLVALPGTELCIRNILPGIKQFSGEKIQWYLASELRDRIRHSGVELRVVDRAARAEFKVEPRQFEGRLLHELGRLAPAELYLELYLAQPNPANAVGLFRHGTRVIDNLATLSAFQKAPWTNGHVQGIVDAPYLNLTPGSRTGIIQDEAYERLTTDLGPVEAELLRILEEQRRAEEEQTSREVLRSIQKAIKEALLGLPAEEYDWFDLHESAGKRSKTPPGETINGEEPAEGLTEPGPASEAPAEVEDQDEPGQKQFFEYAGPLFSVRVSPASSVIPVAGAKNFRAITRDRANRLVEEGVRFQWTLLEGDGQLVNSANEIATFQAPSEPGLSRLRVTATQGEIECSAEALITVTQSLLPEIPGRDTIRQGMPSYTFQKASGELWRSRYQADQNVVVINNGHRDFVFASRNRMLKVRYICRLFTKELVVKNFAGASPAELLERLIELSLYTEEHLK
ncbi:MAG TPA: ATP-binding protein [Candidatus Saccharimonadales bacterium]|nr:ATP-binding protein [Candidatus Saccharimonadales bacterium]